MSKSFNSQYSFLDLVRLSWSLLVTKVFFRPARIIRQPTRIRGFGYMDIGVGFTTGQFCRIEASKSVLQDEVVLRIGKNVQINDACHIAAIENVSIGDNVLIASRVFISDHDHGRFSKDSLKIIPKERELISSPVKIKDSVWIGEGVIILKGVTIGKGAVIGAGAVVTRDVPANSLAIGVPAKIVKSYEL